MSDIKAGQIYNSDHGNKWLILAIGEQQVFAKRVNGVDAGYETTFTPDYIERHWKPVLPFFKLGKTYKRNGSPSYYKVQSLYQNGEHQFAVLFFNNPLTDVDGIVGASIGDFPAYMEV